MSGGKFVAIMSLLLLLLLIFSCHVLPSVLVCIIFPVPVLLFVLDVTGFALWHCPAQPSSTHGQQQDQNQKKIERQKHIFELRLVNAVRTPHVTRLRLKYLIYEDRCGTEPLPEMLIKGSLC